MIVDQRTKTGRLIVPQNYLHQPLKSQWIPKSLFKSLKVSGPVTPQPETVGEEEHSGVRDGGRSNVDPRSPLLSTVVC